MPKPDKARRRDIKQLKKWKFPVHDNFSWYFDQIKKKARKADADRRHRNKQDLPEL